ncbi:MAG: hypothetical protein LBG43_07245 [Treponema sp.]|nr:hypothetical protein [Treponema sp.]
MGMACALALALFSACAPEEDLLDGLPLGTWVSGFGETYTITDSAFTKSYGPGLSYSGTITATRKDGLGAGYITIKYTQYTDYGPAPDYEPTLKDADDNEYYVIHWRELKVGGVELSDAYGAENNAELPVGAVFAEKDIPSITVANGYFNTHSTCKKQ